MKAIAWMFGGGGVFLLIAWLLAAQFPATYLSFHLERNIQPFPLQWAVTRALNDLQDDPTSYCNDPFLFAFQGSWGIHMLVPEGASLPSASEYRELIYFAPAFPHEDTGRAMVEFNEVMLAQCF